MFSDDNETWGLRWTEVLKVGGPGIFAANKGQKWAGHGRPKASASYGLPLDFPINGFWCEVLRDGCPSWRQPAETPLPFLHPLRLIWGMDPSWMRIVNMPCWLFGAVSDKTRFANALSEFCTQLPRENSCGTFSAYAVIVSAGFRFSLSESRYCYCQTLVIYFSFRTFNERVRSVAAGPRSPGLVESDRVVGSTAPTLLDVIHQCALLCFGDHGSNVLQYASYSAAVKLWPLFRIRSRASD